jgi:hypothetical protein
MTLLAPRLSSVAQTSLVRGPPKQAHQTEALSGLPPGLVLATTALEGFFPRHQKTERTPSETEDNGRYRMTAFLANGSSTYNLIGHALKKVLQVVAEQRAKELGEVGKEASAELVCTTSLKAALDRDWDRLTEREEALTLVLQVLQAVETWVQTLPQEEAELAQLPLEIAKQVRQQDVEINEQGKASLIKGIAKDRRISIEDAEMRHGRKSCSVRVDGYKRHVLHDLDTGATLPIFRQLL